VGQVSERGERGWYGYGVVGDWRSTVGDVIRDG
jgi:hypothetical protein